MHKITSVLTLVGLCLAGCGGDDDDDDVPDGAPVVPDGAAPDAMAPDAEPPTGLLTVTVYDQTNQLEAGADVIVQHADGTVASTAKTRFLMGSMRSLRSGQAWIAYSPSGSRAGRLVEAVVFAEIHPLQGSVAFVCAQVDSGQRAFARQPSGRQVQSVQRNEGMISRNRQLDAIQGVF